MGQVITRLFDEHGQRMTPTHTNKKGVRYLYYISPAVLRKHSAGPLGRAFADLVATSFFVAVDRFTS
jgi:site-specific DNA recombinase